jgi:zinc protease
MNYAGFPVKVRCRLTRTTRVLVLSCGYAYDRPFWTLYCHMRLTKLLIPGLVGLCVAAGASTSRAQKKSQTPPAPAPAPVTPYSGVERDSLLNGLQIITLERNGEPMVTCDIVIVTGSMFDPAGKVGLARLTQSILVGANPRLKEEIASLQGKIDWGVDWDTTWIHFEIPPAGVETALEIVGRLMVIENIRPATFSQQVDGELAQVRSNSLHIGMAERADATFFGQIYGDHPYGHAIQGDERSLAGIRAGDVLDYYRRFYLPNDAFVVVVGPVRHERIMRDFRTFFGSWAKGQIVPSTFRPPPRESSLRLIKTEVPDAPAVELRAGLIGVKLTDPDFIVTQVMAQILGERLKQVPASDAASQVSVSAPGRLLPGPFYFSAAVAPDRAAAFSRRATDSLAALATGPVAPEELASAKAALKAQEAARPIIEQLRKVEVFGLAKNYPLNWPGRVDAVAQADIQRVAKRLLEANAMTIVVVGKIDDQIKSQR